MELIEIYKHIPVEYINREKFFLNENGEVLPVIEMIKNHYLSIAIDGSTEEGRKALKKLAAELNKVKAEIDGYGKEVVDVLKAKPKKIDAGRKVIKDALEAAYEEIVKPVREYEAEQARIKAEAEAKAAEEQRLKDEELARLRAESERIQREELIKQKAVKESEEKAAREIAKAKAEIEAKEIEKAREEQRIADEQAKRESDEQHRRSIKNNAFNQFINNGINREIAIKIIQIIDSGLIDNIKIHY